LPEGVVTRGFYDNRPAVSRLPIPASLEGARCLDVGSADGFWALEMERRGAAEVVAIDLDDPARRDWPTNALGGDPERRRGDLGRSRAAFALAAAALDSKVKRMDLSVYETDPETIGQFDFVFLGSLLLHLRDPAGALAALRTVTTGRLLVNDAVSGALSLLAPRTPLARLQGLGRPLWWTSNVAGLVRLVESAGYRILGSGGPYRMDFGEGFPRPPGLRGRVRARVGSPHAWVLAEPDPA
jgi:tRNA (mo5U34)-methyltransferase